MYRVHLSEKQQQELRERAHQKSVAPRLRDRLEMLRLSAMGWSIPKIARHLHQHEQTVRYWVKAFLEEGFDALTDQPHIGKTSAVTPDILAAVRKWLSAGDRTWNARQVANEVNARYGILRSLGQWHRLLRRQQMTYKRTRRTLHHKQNPAQVAAKTQELDALKKGPIADNWTCAISTKPVLR